MKKLFLSFSILVFFASILSCQKEVSDFGQSGSTDTTKQLRLTRIVNFDPSTNDSVVIFIKYQLADRKIVFYYQDTNSISFILNYDNDGYLLREDQYDLNAVVSSTVFKRNSSKDLIGMEYEWGPLVQVEIKKVNIPGSFGYHFIDTTQVSRMESLYAFNSNGDVQELIYDYYLSNPLDYRKIKFTYSAKGILNTSTYLHSQIIDTNLNTMKDSSVNTFSFETRGGGLALDFAKMIAGKDLQWIPSHWGSEMTYVLDLLRAGPGISERVLKEWSGSRYEFINGAWTFDYAYKETYENSFDSDGNLVESKLYSEQTGIPKTLVWVHRFYYSKQ